MNSDDWLKLVSMFNGVLAIWNAELLYVNWGWYKRSWRAVVLMVIFICAHNFVECVLDMFS